MNMLPKKYYLDNLFDVFAESKLDMKCDVYEDDLNYHIEADVPGFDKKDIDIECSDGYLTITASKEEVKDESEKNYIRKERSYGKVTRSFYVGNISEDKVDAIYEHGILKITVPKQEKNKKTIEIK